MDAELRHLQNFGRELNAWLSFREAQLTLACTDAEPVKRAADRVRNALATAMGEALVPEIRRGLDEIEAGVVRAREKLYLSPS